jgi:hypothetical protein
MSRPALETITCKSCGCQQQFTVWESLNITLDPEKRRDLVTGDLTRFTCEKCGWSSEVLHALLYHDMEKRVLIWLVPPGGDLNKDLVPFVKRMADYRFRRVTTRNQLVDKMLIFDCDLDDRVVECFKLLIQYRLVTEKKPVPRDLFFLDVTESDVGEEIIVFEFNTDGQAQCFEFPLNTFHELEALVEPHLPASKSERGLWLQVNAEYARPIFKELGDL